jgi:hypothetical protein
MRSLPLNYHYDLTYLKKKNKNKKQNKVAYPTK